MFGIATQKNCLLESIVLLVFTTVAIVLGSGSLLDPDIGWHLSGGLWMLENGTVPTRDPLGSEGSFWLAYSWLFEVFIALIFRVGGFEALRLVQVCSAVLSVWCYWFFVHEIAKSERRGNGPAVFVSSVLSLAVIILFAAPVWHLRPQLFSVILFGALVYLAETRRLRFALLAPILILWVNIHVFWVFVLLVVFLYRLLPSCLSRKWRDALKEMGFLLAILALALINPYGWKSFPAIYEYAFCHAEAYKTIVEFSSLSPSAGYLFWVFLGVIVVCLVMFHRIGRETTMSFKLLFVIVSILALSKIKFVPLFGVLAGVALVRGILPGLKVRSFAWQPNKSTLTLTISVIALVFVCALSFESSSALPERTRELLRVAESFDKHPGKEIAVLNHFNDGGWLSLGFWLSRPNGAKESLYKTAIDGRTLVMGEKRIEEYRELVSMCQGWCEILKSWDVRIAVLPDMGLREALEKDSLCSAEWRIQRQGENFTVLLRRTL